MLASAIFVLLQVAAFDGTVSDAAAPVETVTAKSAVLAKVIKREAPDYPRGELMKGKEAWVHVTYCIDESGETRNISILDSVGGPRFEKAAIEAVEQWQFEPALMGGEPSWQSRNQAYISFAISQSDRGADRKFVWHFKKLGKLIEEEKLEEADELFWLVHDTFDLSLYEVSKLWAQRVRFESLTGDLQKLAVALHRATASDGQWIDKKSYIQLLRLRVEVEAMIGQYKAAIEAFEELTEVAGGDSEEANSTRPVIERLNELIASDAVLKIEAKVGSSGDCINCNSSWNFSPVRRVFTLSNISGNLTSMDIRCDHKRYEFEVSDDVEWDIPDALGSCNVSVYGDPGATFDVLLPPDPV